MHYTKLSVAGCAALMFGLIACSGEDGKDGVNGVNGLNGADGASCEVKSLKDETGYKILCGGDSVGVLLNGKAGATGKQGSTGATGAKGETGKTGAKGDKGDKGDGCSVAALADNSGYDVYCGADKVGTIKNGTNGKDGQSCSTQAADDGIVISCNGQITKITNGKDGTTCSAKTVTKDGRNGIEMSCAGEVVGTVWDGKDGTSAPATENCTSTDNNDGTYTLKCGTADAMTLYKAVCGVDPYDPADKFCVLGKIYDKCGTDKVAYKVNTEYCQDGKVVPACLSVKLDVNVTGDPQFEGIGENRRVKIKPITMRAPTENEFCLNGFIMPKCDGKEYGVDQFCGKTTDKKKDSLMTYCERKSKLEEAAEDWLDFKAEQEKLAAEAAETAAENAEPSPYGTLIGRSVFNNNEETTTKVRKFFTVLEDSKLKAGQFCENYTVVEKCGTETYKTKTQFCDKRDNHIYNMVELADGLWWMTDNLAFNYKLPRVNGGKASVGTDINFADTSYQNYDSEITAAGRYYSWFAAIGADDIRYSKTALPADWYNDVGEDYVSDKNYKTIPGACPEGWRLPSVNELKTVIENTAMAKKLNLVQSGYYNITFTVTPETPTTPKVVTMNKTFTEQTKVFLWTYDVDENDKGIIGLEDLSGYKFTSFSKEMALPIRCVQGEWIDLRDEDNDGVLNEFDQCLGTDEQANVDANGCPVDTDEDDVPDYLDECPDEGTEVTGQVGENGCPVAP